MVWGIETGRGSFFVQMRPSYCAGLCLLTLITTTSHIATLSVINTWYLGRDKYVYGSLYTVHFPFYSLMLCCQVLRRPKFSWRTCCAIPKGMTRIGCTCTLIMRLTVTVWCYNSTKGKAAYMWSVNEHWQNYVTQFGPRPRGINFSIYPYLKFLWMFWFWFLCKTNESSNHHYKYTVDVFLFGAFHHRTTRPCISIFFTPDMCRALSTMIYNEIGLAFGNQYYAFVGFRFNIPKITVLFILWSLAPLHYFVDDT